MIKTSYSNNVPLVRFNLLDFIIWVDIKMVLLVSVYEICLLR